MMTGVLLALLLSLPNEGSPLPIQEGGFCAGISWISVANNDGLSVDEGPDFRVYRYDGPAGRYWGIYSGNAAQVSDSEGTTLFDRDGVSVRSAIVDGQFRGYLATDRRGSQNHFFGSVFTNGPLDEKFFDQVDFGPAGQAKCERYRPK